MEIIMNQIKLMGMLALVTTSSLVFTSCESEDASAELETSENVFQELNSKKRIKKKKDKDETETEDGFILATTISITGEGFVVDGTPVRGDINIGAQIDGNELFFVAKLPKPIAAEHFLSTTAESTTRKISASSTLFSNITLEINGEEIEFGSRNFPNYRTESGIKENLDGTVSVFRRVYDILGKDGEPISEINTFSALAGFSASQENAPDRLDGTSTPGGTRGPSGSPTISTIIIEYNNNNVVEVSNNNL